MVGKPIATLRQAKGWSQQKLATAAGISMQNLSKIEGDKISPRESTLSKIADALDCSVADFYAKRAKRRSAS